MLVGLVSDSGIGQRWVRGRGIPVSTAVNTVVAGYCAEIPSHLVV